jgi:Tfp pilus assembly protein PilF
VALAALATLWLATAHAAPNDYDVCLSGDDADTEIAACTRVINARGSSRERIGEAFIARCQHYYEKDDYDHAIEDCTKAIPYEPKWIQVAYGDRANAHAMKKEKEEAIRDYTKAIELDPNYPAAYTGRGLLYEDAGMIDKAREDYKSALATNSILADTAWAHKTAREHLQKLDGN